MKEVSQKACSAYSTINNYRFVTEMFFGHRSFLEKGGIDMQLVKWSYMRRDNIKAIYDQYPNSPVIFRKIRDYYFVYTIQWTPADDPVGKSELEQMEKLLNRELGTEYQYLYRRK